MKALTAIFIFTGLCSSFLLRAQSGWTRPAGGWYAQVTASHFNSHDYYSTEGRLFDAGSTFESSGLLVFAEYGITDRLTAVVDIPTLVLNRFRSTETVAGIGSVKLGVKYRLLPAFPLSLQIDLDIPTDDGTLLANAKQPNDLGIIENINLPTSDGEFNVWTTLAASRSTADGRTFGSISTSINFRTESFSNQLQAGLEVGHLFFDRLFLIGKLRIQESLRGEDRPASAGATFLFGEGTTFTHYNLTALYRITDQWQLVAGASDISGFLIDRRNVYDGFTFSLGMALEY